METVMGIGGWLAQTVIESSIGTLTSSALEKCKIDPGMNDALLSLNTSLSKANAILDMSHKMKAETHLNNLLKQLKEAAYDAGDVVDDLKYEELKKRVEDDEGDHPSSGPLSKKQKIQQLGKLVSSSFQSAIDLPNDATDKVREVQKRLNEITAAIEQVVTISSAVGAKEPDRVREESSSFLLDPQVFGRAEDQQRLTELLLGQDEGTQSSNNVFVPVISLVGMGGIGKTTLAQWAYWELGSKFEEKIWICASDPFDVNRLTREIVQTVDSDKEYSTLTKLNKLQEIVKKQLARKRFLLVIDDVWNEAKRKWEIFYAPLRLGAPGSKILVTTRSRDVAAVINSKYTMLLEGLQKDEYYSFFNRCAFGHEDPKKYGRMEAIGRNIAARLKGLPLAAKTLGSLLNSHLNEEYYWKNIQDSKIWNLQQDDNDIMPVLKLSFDNLSTRLKPCFAYCSLFPKDYIFRKGIIVQMWMAQDFIVPEANLRTEDVGYKYFDDLFSRCLFEKLPDYFQDGGYVMHDLLHDLAQSISKDECVRLECGGRRDIPSTVRHLSVCVRYPELNISAICKHKKLRTLLFVSNRLYNFDVEFSVEREDLLSHLTCVRIMVLRGSFKVLPDSIGELKQLRYLDINSTKIKEFPESLCFLYNLQRFKVTPRIIMSYPKRMENLVNLRKFPEEQFISQVADVGRLTCLQQLNTFSMKKEMGHKIEELRKLTELRGRLDIEHLEGIDSKEEAMKAKLKDKKYLRELSLHWASDRRTDLRRIDVADVQVLEGLQPHPNLKELMIQNYSGVKYPSWLESQLLSNLITVILIGCKNMEKLPPLGQLPFLKVLALEDLHAVKRVGEELYGTTEPKAFTLLEKLVLQNMFGWEEWSPAYSSQLFPCLKEIIIENCPKLKELPFFPPLVVKLKIIGLEVNELPFLGHLSCLEEIYIDNCPKLKVSSLLPPTVVKFELKNVESNELTFLGHSSCLEEICIENCPKLKVLSLFPPTVVKLELKNVELNEFPPIGHLSGLKILRCNVRCLVAVRKIEDLFGAGESKGFPSLKEFELVDMPELEEWSGVYGSQFFPCLTKLFIENCPELRNLPSLPPSLQTLRLVKVGLVALLPVSSWVSQESSSSSSRQNASLRDVFIWSCPNLKSVEEWLLPNQLPALCQISIIDCAELTSLAIERFKDLTSLGFLTLKDCPKLTSAAAEAEEDNLLFPSSLYQLELGNCGDLARSLLLCLRGATSLSELTITGDYRHIISLPGEFFHNLTTLGYWTVEGLTELKTLESLQRFTSLRYLAIRNCPQLKALPEDSLPNLYALTLFNCHPDLKERCQQDTGEDWPKFAHIPAKYID